MPQGASSSSDSAFTPRKEFIREQKAAPNAFALLAIAGNNFIRLYSFPPPVTTAFRRLFEKYAILAASREHASQNLYEFTLEGKPWASPKSVITEKLLIEILAIIYHCGFTYLSTLDYGRESDDRLAMAFSRPSPSPTASPIGTPLPTSPIRDSSASLGPDKYKRRIPFALSFISSTVMRVIAPPLHLTPAILQAVRASWPRGVVSEKKVGDNSFEFKLKGYKWFQQDTFASDSLRHILALLSSLDAHSFTLLSSISLTNRSRVKDLWVFTGPAPSSTDDLLRHDSLVPSILDSSHGDIKRRVHSPELIAFQPHGSVQGSSTHHRRFVTEPNIPLPHPSPSQHVRAATDDPRPPLVHVNEPQHVLNASSTPLVSPSLLRKPAPRAQVPVSVAHETDVVVPEAIRANLPSTISSSAENMTGVGASGFSPDVFYTASPSGGLDAAGRPVIPVAPVAIHTSSRQRSVTPPNRTRSPLRPVSTRAKTPPLLVSNPPSPPSSPPRPASTEEQRSGVEYTSLTPPVSPKHWSTSGAAPLLGAGAFRDSAFSSTSDFSSDVPIKWTGVVDAIAQKGIEAPEPMSKPKANRASTGPMLPGGWQPTPIEEKSEVDFNGMANQGAVPQGDNNGGAKTPIHEVASRITSPDFTEPDVRMRKSEAALVGMIAETSPPPLPESRGNKDADLPSPGTGQGWVLVNVEGTADKSAAGAQSPSPPPPLLANIAETNRQQPSSEQAAKSPHAKAIVIMDAMDANKPNSGTSTPVKKRFFGLGRKSSKKVPSDTSATSKDEKEASPRTGFREKFRLMGTPEAPRNEGKRRSID